MIIRLLEIHSMRCGKCADGYMDRDYTLGTQASFFANGIEFAITWWRCRKCNNTVQVTGAMY